MYNEVEIKKILQRILEIKKKFRQPSKDSDLRYPAYNPTYNESVELYEKIAVHAEGKFPSLMFKKKAPNEDDEVHKWREYIYKPRTMSFWERGLSTIQRIWNENNYFISKWEDKPKDAITKDYFLKYYPGYNSIINYFQSIVTDWKLRDPNAVIAVKPRMIPLKNDSNSDLKFDDTKLIEPVCLIYRSEQIMTFDETHLFVLTDQKSEVISGDKKVNEGLIFEFYDNENIWTISQTGEKTDNKFQIEIYYNHSLNYLPCWKLKGKSLQRLNDILYYSYFMSAVPNLDAVTCNYSNLDMSFYFCVYPHKWEIVEKCNVKGCVNGMVFVDGKEIQCKSCSGTGKMKMTSPTGVTQIQMRTNISPGAGDVPIPPFGFVSPPVDALRLIREQIQQDIAESFSFLNINVSPSNVVGSETALGKMIDREELFSFLLKISSELFELLSNTIQAIGQMRYMDNFTMPEIKPPVTFEIRSEKELIEEINQARESDLPLPAFKLLINEWIRKRFNNNIHIEKIIDIVFRYDSLITFTEQEIAVKFGSKQIELWEVILHKDIYKYLEDMDLEDKKIGEKLIAEAKSKVPIQSNILERANQ